MGQQIYIRRCHICGGVNEAPTTSIDKCQHCQKHLAPFYFNKEELEKSGNKKIEMSIIDYAPLKGLSVLW